MQIPGTWHECGDSPECAARTLLSTLTEINVSCVHDHHLVGTEYMALQSRIRVICCERYDFGSTL